jgi:voltage-gated potassium channel
VLRRLRFALAALAIVLVAGSVGYMLIEGWSPLDSLYMTVITVGTVGFSEVHPMSAPGRLFTMALIFIGFASTSDHHVVAGLGRVGSIVAEEFAERGLPFVVIDSDETTLQRARERDWMYVHGDASEEETLAAAGIPRAKSLVAALDTDADNLFVTLSARGMKPDLFIVARSTTASAEAKLLRAGADRVMTPTEIGGRRMAAMVVEPGCPTTSTS